MSTKAAADKLFFKKCYILTFVQRKRKMLLYDTINCKFKISGGNTEESAEENQNQAGGKGERGYKRQSDRDDPYSGE